MQIGCLPDREETRDRGKTCEAQTSSTGLQIRPKCPGCDRPCGKKHQPEEADTDSSLDLVKTIKSIESKHAKFFFFFFLNLCFKKILFNSKLKEIKLNYSEKILQFRMGSNSGTHACWIAALTTRPPGPFPEINF